MENNKFVVVVPVYNAENFIEKCINSIISQDYDNYKLVVIDDCSTDNTNKILQDFYKRYNFDLITNTERISSPVANIIKGIKLTSNNKEDIIITVDGDDWLVGNDVFSYLNEVYQDKEIYMSYGQFQSYYKVLYNEDCMFSTYCRAIPDTRKFRESGLWLVHHLRTFKRKLWDLIDDNDLRDDKGEYYKMASDVAWIYPIVELAGPKHIKFIEKVLYTYNDCNDINEFKIDFNEQMRIKGIIMNKPLYDEIDEI